jgi:Tfp pilus assembly protein PilW
VTVAETDAARLERGRQAAALLRDALAAVGWTVTDVEESSNLPGALVFEAEDGNIGVNVELCVAPWENDGTVEW